MLLFSWILNLPYTLLGLIFGIISLPKSVSLIARKGVPIYVLKTRTLKTVLGVRNVRGITFGTTVLLGPLENEGVLEHELVHVEQYLKYPVIFPFLYLYQVLRYGYRQAPFEDEAYTRVGNRYGR